MIIQNTKQSPKTMLRSFFRKYFNTYMHQYHKENRNDAFLINMGLNFCRPIFLDEWKLHNLIEEDFDAFFKNVFKDKIKMIKC